MNQKKGLIFNDTHLPEYRQDKYLIYIRRLDEYVYLGFYDNMLKFFKIKRISRESFNSDQYVMVGKFDAIDDIEKLYNDCLRKHKRKRRI